MRRFLWLPLVMVLAASPAAAIDIFNVKNSLIQFALSQISTDDFTIEAEDVESPGDGVTELVGVTIADRDGVWFRAERMGLQWNARRILSAELEINRLSAEGVEVLRQPQGTVTVEEDAEIAQTDDDPFDWPRAPITTRVEEMRLDRVFIAEGVLAGQSIRFDARGSARDEGDIQAVALNVTRTDTVTGRIALDYERDFAADTLKVDLGAEEAAGGLVADLAGLPNDAASRVSVKADGPLTAWSMDFEAMTERVFEAAGEARVDLQGRIGVEAGFRVSPGPGMEPRVAALMGETARLDIDIAEDEEGVIRIRQGRLDSPALTLTAEGSYVRATRMADLDVVLDGQAALSDLAEGVAFDGVGFDGRVSGTPDDLTANGALTLAGLETDPADVGTAELATDVRVEGPRITFDVSGRTRGLRLDRLRPETVGETDLVARGVWDGQTATLSTFTLNSGLLSAEASGEVAVEADRVGLDYALTAPRLAPIAAAYEADASGAFRVSGTVAGPLSAPRLTGEATLTDMVFEGESYGVVRLTHDIRAGEVVTGTADVTASGSPVGAVDASTVFTLRDRVLDLTSLSAEALGATVDGAVSYRLDSGLAEGVVTLDAPDLAPLSRFAGAPATGAVSGRIALRPVEERQDAVLDLTAEGVDAFGAKLARLTLDGRLRDALGTPALTAEMTAFDAGYGDARVTGVEGRIEGTDLAATPDLTLDLTLTGAQGFEARASRMTLAATVTDATSLADVTARLTATEVAYQDVTAAEIAADLTAADAMAPVPEADLTLEARRIGGPVRTDALDLTARLREAGGTARAEADLRLAPLTAGGARVAGATLRLTADDALGADPRIDARLGTGEVRSAEIVLGAVTARARGLLSALSVTLATEGTLEDRPLALDAAATANATAAPPRVRVTRLDAALAEDRVSLNAPFTVTAGTETTIRSLDVALPEGRLAGDATLYPAGLAAEIDLALGDLGLLQRLAEVPVSSGALDLSARFDTRPSRAGGQARVDARNLAIDGVVLGDEDPLGLQADLDWTGRRAELAAAVTGPFGAPMRLDAAGPLRASGGMLPEVPGGGAISGAIVWNGEVGRIWALVPGADHVLDGNLALDLQVSGTVREPEIGGSVSLDDGRYENLMTGTILTDLSVGSDIAPNGDLTLTATARDGADGTVAADVTVAGDRVRATVQSQDAVLVRRDDVKAALALDLTAEGPLTGPDIAGTVTITRAEVRLVNATPPSVATLGDVRIKGTEKPEPAEPAGSEIDLDIAIRANRDIFVRGRGLDSEWQADLLLDGTAARPRMTGEIRKVRGVLNFIGTEFDLATGIVRFTGGREIDPVLDVRLETERNNLLGGIRVEGRASSPEIRFFSTPSLPEDEVLPRLLYGETSQSLSAGQAIQLGSGVATLMSGSGGAVDKVRSTVGLDTLAVDPAGESASVTVGKNIGENVFVGATQSVEGRTSVTVEVEVLPSITVDGEIGAEGDQSVGVNWKMDF